MKESNTDPTDRRMPKSAAADETPARATPTPKSMDLNINAVDDEADGHGLVVVAPWRVNLRKTNSCLNLNE